MATSVNQETAAPTTKVTAFLLGGALTSIFVWVLEETTKVSVSSEVANALTLLFGFITAYITKEKI